MKEERTWRRARSRDKPRGGLVKLSEALVQPSQLLRVKRRIFPCYILSELKLHRLYICKYDGEQGHSRE